MAKVRVASLWYCFWLFMCIAGLTNGSFAREYIVSQDGLGDFNRIADCVAAMKPGDRCTVWPGDYPERVVLPARLASAGQRTVISADPPLMATVQGFDVRGCDNVRIEGFDVANNYPTGLDATGILIRSNNVEIANNYIHAIRGGGIVGYWVQPWSNNITIENNRITRCQSGINICGNQWYVVNNEVTRLIQYSSGDCDYARFFGENHLIKNNIFFGTYQSEIGSAHVDGFQTYDDNGEYFKDVVILGNVIRDCHQGVMTEADKYQQSSGLYIVNNIFANCWSWGADVHDVTNVLVAHNVFANMLTNGVGARAGSSVGLFNNVFYNAGSNYFMDPGAALFCCDNLLFSTKQKIDASIYSWDITNLNPCFRDAAGLDFHLTGNSPAIDAGVDVGLTMDFDDQGRPVGSFPDIGAFEYVPLAGITAAHWQQYR